MGVIAKQSIKGASANYLGVLIGAITTFFVVTDLLTQEEIGLTRVMVDAAMLFAGLAQLGTNASIVRFYPRFRTADRPELRDHGFFGWTLMLPLLGFTVIATLFFIFKNQIVAYYSQEAPLLTNYVSLLLPLTFFVLYMTVFETNASVLLHIAVPKFVREVVIRVLNLIAYLLYGHRVISLDLFVILFCSSYAVATLVNFLYLLSLGRISFRPDWHFMNHNLLREVGVYTLFMTATVLAGNIKLFNSIFIAKTSLAAAGIYTIACYIANVVEIPYRSLGAISSPISSQAIVAMNTAPISSPRHTVPRSAFASRRQNSSARNTNAIMKRTASRLSGTMLRSAILDSKNDPDRATITAASSSSERVRADFPPEFRNGIKNTPFHCNDPIIHRLFPSASHQRKSADN